MTNFDIDLIISGIKESFSYSNIEDLVAMLGINFKIIDYTNPILSGQDAAYLMKNDREYIYLSNRCADEYKSFALAHELGHAILHDAEISFLAQHKTRTEEEADYFAIRILNLDFELFEGYTSEDYAKIYGIRESAVKYII